MCNRDDLHFVKPSKPVLHHAKKVYTVASPEFGELEGHILVIVKALYGLCGSGHAYWQKFASSLRKFGFFPCK